jgi:hypothetical protein
MDRNTVPDAATSHADARDDQDVTDARAHVTAATDHYKRAASGKPPPVTVVPAPGTPQPVRKAPPPRCPARCHHGNPSQDHRRSGPSHLRGRRTWLVGCGLPITQARAIDVVAVEDVYFQAAIGAA